LLVAKQISQIYEPERQVTGHPRPKRKKRSPVVEKILIVGCVLTGLAIGLILTATHAELNRRAAKIIQIKSEITSLQNDNERLKFKIAQLKSLDRIEMIACTELGMVKPGIDNIRYIALEENSGKEKPLALKAEGEVPSETVKIKSGEKINPLLLAINKLVTDYIFGVGQVEASERPGEP